MRSQYPKDKSTTALSVQKAVRGDDGPVLECGLPLHNAHQVCLVKAAVSLDFGITELDLIAPESSGRHVRFARQVAMYLTHVVYELNHTHIGRLFLKDRSTVSHACKVVEDSREDGVFDLKLIRLENFLRQAPRPVIFDDMAA